MSVFCEAWTGGPSILDRSHLRITNLTQIEQRCYKYTRLKMPGVFWQDGSSVGRESAQGLWCQADLDLKSSTAPFCCC